MGAEAAPRRARSLTARLTLLFIGVSAAVLLAVVALVWRSIGAHFVELDHDSLQDRLHAVRVAAADAADLQAFARRLTDIGAGGATGFAVEVRDTRGAVRLATPGIAFAPPGAAQRPGAIVEWTQGGATYHALRGDGVLAGEPVRITVAIDTVHHAHFLQGFRRQLGAGVAVALLASGVLGWLAARRGLRPLSDMRERAARVTAQRLDARMPEDAVPVEMAQLARELNAMLARLQADFARLSDFSSDLAHELRTPLANLMTQTEVALSQPREGAQYRDVLASNAEELQRLSRMVADMLFLARAENGLALPSRERVPLSEEVRALFSFYDALAEDRGLVLALEGDATIDGDRLMVRRALSNLLSNAIRHADPGSTVHLRIATADGQVHVAVENTGVPLDAALVPRLFDRFWRADPSRTHAPGDATDDGAGLGLAITRAIVVAHGGSAAVEAHGRTTRMVLRFPL